MTDQNNYEDPRLAEVTGYAATALDEAGRRAERAMIMLALVKSSFLPGIVRTRGGQFNDKIMSESITYIIFDRDSSLLCYNICKQKKNAPIVVHPVLIQSCNFSIK